MPLSKKHVRYSGRVVMIGFGSIGQGTLPLILRHRFQQDVERLANPLLQPHLGEQVVGERVTLAIGVYLVGRRGRVVNLQFDLALRHLLVKGVQRSGGGVQFQCLPGIGPSPAGHHD